MTIDWSVDEKVIFTMYDYLEDILAEVPDNFDGEGVTPAVGEDVFLAYQQDLLEIQSLIWVKDLSDLNERIEMIQNNKKIDSKQGSESFLPPLIGQFQRLQRKEKEKRMFVGGGGGGFGPRKESVVYYSRPLLRDSQKVRLNVGQIRISI